MNFEEVSYPGSDLVTSDVFHKQRSRQVPSNNSSREWRNKLNLEKNPLMDNRTVEITDVQLITDGYSTSTHNITPTRYLSSHKEYKIRSYLEGGNDEKEISRRYSDFEWLVSRLVSKYPGVIIPPLPEKNPLANINQENMSFLESRKRGLLFFLQKLLQHQDLRYAPDFETFLMANDIVRKSDNPP